MWNKLSCGKVLVVGAARSGIAVANLMKASGCEVTINDQKDVGLLGNNLLNLSEGVKVSVGGHPLSLLDETDLIVLSPGVPMDIPLLIEARARGIKVISEIEAAYQLLSRFMEAMPFVGCMFLAVTGTNGKSTTTTLLYELIKGSGYNAILSGNIGNALSGEVHRLINSEHVYDMPNIYFFVTELSSFQLEGIETFRPFGSTILNITPDHLDRYKDMSEYVDAKCRVFKNQGPMDFVVLNADDPYTGDILNRIRQFGENGPRVFFFSRQRVVEGAYCLGDILKVAISHKDCERSIFDVDPEACGMTLSPTAFQLRGVHNLENIMAATVMAVLSGCKRESIEHVLCTFKGLEHRLEFVRELEGVTYINDSKGTNIGAVAKSLEGFNTPVILIAGGRDKASDFSLLRPYIQGRVKALVLIGEAAEKIGSALKDCCDMHYASTLTDAVVMSKALAQRGDTVLLSPACASFDMFRDFEDRGRQFKEIVVNL